MSRPLTDRALRAGRFLRRRAEDAVVALLTAMFAVFLLQIISRYLLSWPIGWTHEVSVMLHLWIVMFGAAFVVRDSEEMRFDLLYGAVGQKGRRVLVILGSATIVALLLWSLPSAWDYVTFMKREKTAYLKVRFDWLYLVYIIFVVAMIARHLWFCWQAAFGRAPEALDPTQKSSGI